MKTKSKLAIVSCVVCLTALTSCNIFPGPELFEPSYTEHNGSNNIQEADHETFGVNIQKKDPNKKNILEKTDRDKIDRAYSQGTDIREQYNLNYLPSLPSTGNSRLLVVPVLLDGTPIPGSYTETDIRKALTKAFFGTSDETGWESVASFYEKSSYGSLNITGEVTNIFNTSVSLKDLQRSEDDASTVYTDRILCEVYDHFFGNHIYEVDDFDSNKDGVVDGVYMVYLSNHDRNGKSALWAYTYWLDPSYHRNSFGAYCWSSYDFMFHNTSDSRFFINKPDAHTYIHESGHLMSLDDYYNAYDGSTAPIGAVDMMDHNIGDHNAFTKYSLGWTVPEIVDNNSTFESKTYTLRPFESSGDSIVIAPNFNGTSMDEYLILEYYTPTGLNKFDSDQRYDGVYEFRKPGVKILHADQRLGVIRAGSNGSYWDGQFVDRVIPETAFSYPKILATNSCNKDMNERGRSISGENLVTFMDSQAKDGFNKFEHFNLPATHENLFKEGSTFEKAYPSFVFNDGSQLKYNIRIDSLTPSECKVTISRK